MKKLPRLPFLVLVALIFSSVRLGAQSDVQTQSVVFAAGQSKASMAGTLRGRQTIDYMLTAKAGQQVRIDLETKHTANYFNLLPPGSNDAAIYIGQIEGNHFDGTLEQAGIYKVRVYLMPSAARRNETADYTLHIALAGN